MSQLTSPLLSSADSSVDMGVREKPARSLYARLQGLEFCLLAPHPAVIPENFVNVQVDSHLYDAVLDEVQRLRGRIYVRDGAIPATVLDSTGRHNTPQDRACWHAVLRDKRGTVHAAIRMAIHFHSQGEVHLENLQTYALIRRMHPGLQKCFADAIAEFIANSRNVPCFFETGGWVVSDTICRQALPPVTVASVYALSRVLGGACGIGAATMRHASAIILKRFGGFAIPHPSQTDPFLPFFDPYYGCEMEVLGFASDRVSKTFEPTVCDVQRAFDTMTVFAPSGPAAIPRH